MEDKHQFEQKMHMEYSSESGILQMNVDTAETPFQAEVNRIDLNPSFIDIHSMMINTKGIAIKFSSLVICETDGKSFTTKMAGVKLNGESSESFFNGMESLKRNMFGEKWETSVERQRQRMEQRRKRIKDTIR